MLTVVYLAGIRMERPWPILSIPDGISRVALSSDMQAATLRVIEGRAHDSSAPRAAEIVDCDLFALQQATPSQHSKGNRTLQGRRKCRRCDPAVAAFGGSRKPQMRSAHQGLGVIGHESNEVQAILREILRPNQRTLAYEVGFLFECCFAPPYILRRCRPIRVDADMQVPFFHAHDEERFEAVGRNAEFSTSQQKLRPKRYRIA